MPASFEIEHAFPVALVSLAYPHPNKPFYVGEYSVNLGGSLALVKLLTLRTRGSPSYKSVASQLFCLSFTQRGRATCTNQMALQNEDWTPVS